MSEILIDKGIQQLSYELIEAIELSELPLHSMNCPHCGQQVRYPTVVRKQDIEAFEQLMKSAQEVLERHGYTEKIIAEVQAQCYINIAKKKAS